MGGWDKAPEYGGPPVRPWVLALAVVLILAASFAAAYFRAV
jgi:hypothetical protein